LKDEKPRIAPEAGQQSTDKQKRPLDRSGLIAEY
jgi:hypothetical protein